MLFDSWVAAVKARAGHQQFSRIPTTPVDEEDGEEKTSTTLSTHHETRRLWSIIAVYFASIGIAILSGSGGYFIGRQFIGEIYQEGLLGMNTRTLLV
jgi:hypothetical protein